jgi:sugar fermentation stimulation protein A
VDTPRPACHVAQRGQTNVVPESMRFPTPLVRGTLLQRYKRFLADVKLDDGRLITAVCPNTGSMMGLTAPGSTVWLSENDAPTRKYRFTWEMVEADLGKGPRLVGINTALPNKIVAEAIANGRIAALAGYPGTRREVKYGRNSRIDLLLDCAEKGKCYVEVKNVHLSRRHGLAEFPDSVTERGTKHLAEMSDMVREGHRAVMVYLIQRAEAQHRGDCRRQGRADRRVILLLRQRLVESEAVAEGVRDLHHLGVPRRDLDAGTRIGVVLGGDLAVKILQPGRGHEHGRARAGIAVMLAQMQKHPPARNLHVERQPGLEAVLPIHLEPQVVQVELPRLGDVEDAQDGDGGERRLAHDAACAPKEPRPARSDAVLKAGEYIRLAARRSTR